MNLNREGVLFDADARNKRNENWAKLEEEHKKVETAAKTASEAKAQSAEALTKAAQADETSSTVKRDLDLIVADAGESNPEVLQARGGEVNLNARLEKTAAQLAETVSKERVQELWINVKDFGAVGDGVMDDYDSLQNALNFARDNKRNVYIPSGIYLISKPIRIYSSMIVEGSSNQNTVIKKVTASTLGTGTDIRDCLIYAVGANSWILRNVRLLGKRKPFNEGNAVTTDGIYISMGSYFLVENVNIRACRIGIKLKTVWSSKVVGVTCNLCQLYAFDAEGSSTSTVFDTCTTWGCGGAYNFVSCVYMTVLNAINDENNGGGRPEDPFLPEGSGGNYLEYRPLFSISASKVNIMTTGAENNYTAFLYCEGSDVVISNPYIYNMTNLASSAGYWHFISVMGTSQSSVKIINPNFQNIVNGLPVAFSRKGIYVETPSRQKVVINKFIPLDNSFGDYKYSTNGIYYDEINDLIPAGKSLVGMSSSNTGFVPKNLGTYTNGDQTIQLDTNLAKVLRFDKGGSNAVNNQPFNMTFRLPLAVKKSNAILKVKLLGSYSGSSDFPKIRFIKGANLNDEGTVVFNVPVSSGVINFQNYVTLNNVSGDFVYFNITLPFGDNVVRLTTIEIEEIL